ncbi:MAG: prolipoprotein diacylglyceryl transferase [Candidatus Komeilibacteria bacterium]
MWWQEYAPNAVALNLGAVQLRWYGVLVTLGIVSAYFLARRLYTKVGSPTVIDDLIIWVVVSGLVGARLFHVFVFEWSYYQDHLGEISAIWNGGIAIQGGLLFGALALIIYCRLKKINIWPLLDVAAPAVALAQAIGRWGNYFNQELYGWPTAGWWGIYINEEFRIKNYKSLSLFHPAFLYESLAMLVVALFLIWLLKKAKTGQTFAAYLIAYGLVRFLMDFVRIDPQIMFSGLKLSQGLSLGMIIIGIIIFIAKQKKTHIASH